MCPRSSHCANSSRRCGSRISAPYGSIKFCFRYWPERPRLPHSRRTMSAGCSRSLSEPVILFLGKVNLSFLFSFANKIFYPHWSRSLTPSVQTGRTFPSPPKRANAATGTQSFLLESANLWRPSQNLIALLSVGAPGLCKYWDVSHA